MNKGKVIVEIDGIILDWFANSNIILFDNEITDEEIKRLIAIVNGEAAERESK